MSASRGSRTQISWVPIDGSGEVAKFFNSLLCGGGNLRALVWSPGVTKGGTKKKKRERREKGKRRKKIER